MSYIIKNKKIVILFAWAILLVGLVILTYATTTKTTHKYYDKQLDAANLTLECFA